ncbi:MAG: HAMP domain-containing histidine kinase [Coriobacteriales bacterium]|nr:HAMP domain-containing histidine kinase [Coriobacteriales bacterium]
MAQGHRVSNEEAEEIIQHKRDDVLAGEKARDRDKRVRDASRAAKGRFKFSNIPYALRLTGAFALTALMTALISACILAVVWEGEFQDYTRENMQIMADRTANQIGVRYEREGSFSTSVLAPASATSAANSDIAIQVLNSDNRVVYDDTWSAGGHQEGGLSLAPSTEQSVTADIVADGQVVGTVRLWAYSSDSFFTKNDIAFRQSSYDAIVVAGVIAVALALLVGFIVARGLVDPIRRVTATAEAVKSGDMNARTGMTGADEISQLGETFDDMADSIQRDRDLERRLTTDVAHELRTPLMGITATVEAIMDGVFDADGEHLGAINSEALRLKRLVEALLNLSRLETGSVRFNEEVIDLPELIGQLVLSHEALLEAAELHLLYDFDDDVIVDGDKDLLRQATANLISNAVRYNSENGTVTVQVRKRDGMAAISVSDTGIGLSQEDIEHVFSRFWRSDAGRDRARGGLGVGLAVVKEIVDYHKGRIEVESEVGKGTTFTLLIPLHQEEAPAKVQKVLGIEVPKRKSSGKASDNSGKMPAVKSGASGQSGSQATIRSIKGGSKSGK